MSSCYAARLFACRHCCSCIVRSCSSRVALVLTLALALVLVCAMCGRPVEFQCSTCLAVRLYFCLAESDSFSLACQAVLGLRTALIHPYSRPKRHFRILPSSLPIAPGKPHQLLLVPLFPFLKLSSLLFGRLYSFFSYLHSIHRAIVHPLFLVFRLWHSTQFNVSVLWNLSTVAKSFCSLDSTVVASYCTPFYSLDMCDRPKTFCSSLSIVTFRTALN